MIEIQSRSTLTVIIPTLNEAKYIGSLLNALNQQTRIPDEIIVADAGSDDGTREIAVQHGAIVIDGGMPAVGRNQGAKVATGDILLFLDADVLPAPTFIEAILDAFHKKNLDTATCLVQAISDRYLDHMLHEATNAMLIVSQKISPHAPGFAILVRRDIHKLINGFNEDLVLAEDHDYVSRASRIGRFAVIRAVRLSVSVRRLEKEGTLPLAVKYLWAEAHVIIGKPIYSTPFDYQFGKHELPDQMETNLSQSLITLKRMLAEVSGGFQRWDDLLSSQWDIVRKTVDLQLTTTQQHAASLKYSINVRQARLLADVAEAYAAMTIRVAQLSVQQAEVATRRATQLRELADSVQEDDITQAS